MVPDPHDQQIRTALTRLESAVERRPGFGRGTDTASATIGDGLRCHTTVGDWSFESDLSTRLGGSATAPSPGVLARAALASCLAMGYRLRAARRGVPVRSIQVTVETDSEIDGMLRTTATAPPGFTGIRYRVALESAASMDELEAVVEEADRLSPVLDVFRRAHELHRSVTITDGPDAADGADGELDRVGAG